MLALKYRFVVDLVAIGHGDELPAALEAHHIGLVIIGPVADIFATFGRKQVGSIPGFLQTGTEPAGRTRTGRALDRRQRAMDDARFFARRGFVQAARVALVVAHPLPVTLVS